MNSNRAADPSKPAPRCSKLSTFKKAQEPVTYKFNEAHHGYGVVALWLSNAASHIRESRRWLQILFQVWSLSTVNQSLCVARVPCNTIAKLQIKFRHLIIQNCLQYNCEHLHQESLCSLSRGTCVLFYAVLAHVKDSCRRSTAFLCAKCCWLQVVKIYRMDRSQGSKIRPAVSDKTFRGGTNVMKWNKMCNNMHINI